MDTLPRRVVYGKPSENSRIAVFCRSLLAVWGLTITNSGQETLKNARLVAPSTSWMGLTVSDQVGDIAPGSSRTIGILLKPDSALAQGVYDDKIVIYSDNHIPNTYHIQVAVTSSAVGNVLFDVLKD